ncbi:MAG: hypothetical protein ACTSQI_07645 [Candidatus Helarchaeota archaeon]
MSLPIKNYDRIFIDEDGYRVPYVDLEHLNSARKMLRMSLNAHRSWEDISQNWNLVGWNNVLFVGLMETGKTQLANHIIDIVSSAYPPEQLNIPFSNSLRWNLDHLEDVFYNLLITDDAVEKQDSYSGMSKESKELTETYFNIRHEIEDRFNRESGYVVTVWGTQMYKALHKRLRQSPITFFTSLFNDEEENKFLRRTLGYAYTWLERKTDLIYLENRPEFNRYCVLKLNQHLYFYEFDLPISQRRKVKVGANKRSNPDFLVIERLEMSGLKRSKIYEALAVATAHKKGQRFTKKEREYVRLLYKSSLKYNDLASIFNASTESLYRIVNKL